MYKVLVADDEPYIRWIIAKTLKEDCVVHEAKNGKECLEQARRLGPDLVVLDLKMPGMDGLEVLARLKEEDPDLPVVMITGHGTIDTAIAAMKAGAYDFVTKPFDIDQLRIRLHQALRMKRLMKEVAYHRIEKSRQLEGAFMETKSPAMAQVYNLVDKLSDTEANVLITGESGTGKELIARMIHEKSPRQNGPLVAVNCAAIPENLVESELFGHEKGAFTGAVKSRAGKFEQASGGTLFLDEIGEIPPDLQVKLLRAIQEKQVERVGGTRSIETDVRLVAATNRDLETAMEQGRFREDLYYRLNVIRIDLPPLRERSGDIIGLARHFLNLKKRGPEPAQLSSEAEDMLLGHDWPGNIRELENCMERALIVSGGGTILPEHLPLSPGARRVVSREIPVAFPDEGINLEETEKALIRAALEKASGNRTRAAALLGITRSALLYRMDKHRLR